MIHIIPKIKFRNRTYILTLMSCEKIDLLLREMLTASDGPGKPKEIWGIRRDLKTVALFREKEFGKCSLTEGAITTLRENSGPLKIGRKDTGTILVDPTVTNIVAEMSVRAKKNTQSPGDDFEA